MKTQQLESHEIESLLDIQRQTQTLIYKLGDIEYSIIELNLEKEKIKEEIIKVQSQNNQIAKDLENKYGEGTIDMEKKEITIH